MPDADALAAALDSLLCGSPTDMPEARQRAAAALQEYRHNTAGGPDPAFLNPASAFSMALAVVADCPHPQTDELTDAAYTFTFTMGHLNHARIREELASAPPADQALTIHHLNNVRTALRHVLDAIIRATPDTGAAHGYLERAQAKLVIFGENLELAMASLDPDGYQSRRYIPY